MKKLSKILVTAILSASMCVSGFLAVNTLKSGSVADAATVTLSQYASTIKTTGVGSGASYVENEKQLKVNTTFTGIKLTGKSGATFDLGTFDIGSSDWAGTYTSVAAATDTAKNESLLEMVFAPHDAEDFTSSDGGGTGELSSVTFTVSQGAKSIDVRFQYYSYSGDTDGHEIVITTKTQAQTDYASYRSNKTALIDGGTRKGRIVPTDAQKLGLGNETLWCGSWGSSTTTAAVYYDFNDVALYTSSQYQASAGGLNNSYLLRDYDSTEKLTNAVSGTPIPWTDSFVKEADGSCLVDVKATFATVNGTSPSSVIVTKVGSTVFNKGVETDAKVHASMNAVEGDTYSFEKFLYFDVLGRTIPASASDLTGLTVKVGADEASATLVEEGEYTFNEETNVYFYDGETLLGSTAVKLTDEIATTLNITGGKAFYSRGGAEKVEITNGTIVKIGDVITFEGDKHAVTEDTYEDIRSLNISGVQIPTLNENVATAIDGYEYVISGNDIRGKATLDIKVDLDNYCDVTIVDEYDGETVKYVWQNDTMNLPYIGVYNGDYRFYGASGGEKVLIGYGRDDESAEDRKYFFGSEPSLFYRVNGSTACILGKDSNDANGTLDKYECLVKGMRLTALYLGVNVYTAYNLETEQLNIVADFNYADLMRWEYYANALDKSKHAQISIRYSIVDSNSGALIAGASYAQNKTAYMVTGSNVEKVGEIGRVTLPVDIAIADGKFLAYGAVATLTSAQGGATTNASATYYMAKADYSDKAIAQAKIASGSLVSDTYGNGYLYAVNVGGANKYSKCDLTDLQELYAKAENDTVITAWAE